MQERQRYGHSISRIVEDNPGRSRFELSIDGELMGWAEYLPAGDSVIIAHTEIDERREGEGLGSALVRGMLDRIRASGKTVIPTCAFTAAYIQRHPEYIDLVDPSLRGRFVSSS
jgi:predicted GNAT family acetyltransferase